MRSLAAACLLSLFGVVAAAAASDPQAFDEIARGHYLVMVGDCAACHTAPGGKPFAGGRPIETPFGNLIAPNITPDRGTGIGAWSDDAFVRAMQSGISRDGGHLYPAMPFTYYTKVSRRDVLAIRAYLNTVEPVASAIKSNQLPFPFNIRASMAVWDTLYFKAGEFAPVPGKPEAWNRGAYLVQGLGHCGACHTRKTSLGGDEPSHALQGGRLQGWYAPDLTSDPRLGLGGWSAQDIADYLRTGHNRVAAATGPMAEVVGRSTSQMTDQDLAAIATYLKDQPAHGAASVKALEGDDPAMRTGQAIYRDACAACHGADGSGVAGLFPALKASPSAQSADPTSLIRVVLRGAQSVATNRAPTGASMPAFGWKLTDDQLASVLTYVRNDWGNAAPAVSSGTVRDLRKQYVRRAD
jgi:mono/diheme cytochrome c family protein